MSVLQLIAQLQGSVIHEPAHTFILYANLSEQLANIANDHVKDSRLVPLAHLFSGRRKRLVGTPFRLSLLTGVQGTCLVKC